MLTLSTLDDLTPETIIRAARATQLPSQPPTSEPMTRSSSDRPDNHKALPPRPPEHAVRRSPSAGPDCRGSSPGPNRLRSLVDFGDPGERAKRRQEALLRQMAADETAAKEEELRQARIKREKAEILEQHEEEERTRREALEEELKRAAMVKAEKHEEERVAAELRINERELKKRMDAEKRLVESQRIEVWRKEEQRRLEDLAQQEETAMQQVELAKQMSRATALQLRAERLSGKDSILHQGWVTIQNANSLVWRRRWFHLNATSMTLYKNDKVILRSILPSQRTLTCEQDLGKVLDTIVLMGCVQCVKEWNHGFEELRAIPHSFAIVFRGEQGPVSAYTDTAKEKVWYFLMWHAHTLLTTRHRPI
jgi:hypothetical protein